MTPKLKLLARIQWLLIDATATIVALAESVQSACGFDSLDQGIIHVIKCNYAYVDLRSL